MQSDTTTVVESPTSGTGRVWVSEEGVYIPPAKVRRIRLAQDALSAAEEAVYDLLWSQKPGGREEPAKTVQAGYDFIMKRTRLSKKTVQRIIDKLIEKGFIEIDIPADIYRRTSTTYRVFNYKGVLERQAARNRFHVAKIGPGVVYVRPVGESDLPTVDETGMSTVVKSTTVTGDDLTTPTVVVMDLTTVVPETTLKIGQNLEQSSSSSVCAPLATALSAYGPADDEAAVYLLEQCRRTDPDCTVEEILHFVEQKAGLVRVRGSRIQNPVGFLLSAVPKCFAGETLRNLREEMTRRREEQSRREREADEELAAMRAEQERILADPASSEEDRRWAQRLLGR